MKYQIITTYVSYSHNQTMISIKKIKQEDKNKQNLSFIILQYCHLGVTHNVNK